MTTIACRACGLPLAVETTTCPICKSTNRNLFVDDAITMVDEVAFVDVVEAVRDPDATVGEYRELLETLQRAADDLLTAEQIADRVGATRFQRVEQWFRDDRGTMGALATALAAASVALGVANVLKPDLEPAPTPPPPPAAHIVNHIEIHIELPENPTEDQIRGFMRQELRRLLEEGKAG